MTSPGTSSASLPVLVVLRHGESAGNADRSFAGWRDAPLSLRGRAQARGVGALLRRVAPRFDVVFTSELSRAIDTAELALLDHPAAAAPRLRRWRLNERHCGALQGRPKREVKNELGRGRLLALRTDWRAVPPLAPAGGPDDPRTDPRYRHVAEPLPLGESLAEVAARTDVVWAQDLAPRLRRGDAILVVGHGLALRLLVRGLEGLPDHLPAWTLGNAAARCYRFDRDLCLQVVESHGGPDEDGVE